MKTGANAPDKTQPLDIECFSDEGQNRVLLASGSPRRFELLQQMGLSPQRVPVTPVDESSLPGEGARAYVLRLAREKAFACQMEVCQPLVAADTAVVVGQGNQEEILGKPENDEMAKSMLRMLAGSSHRVLTGVCVRLGADWLVEAEETQVTFAALTETTIDAYVKTGEGTDKAGGYAIQGIGGQFVESIRGSYSNVVGLPLCVTRLMLQQIISKSDDARWASQG